ncbi:serine protease snake-like isoform X2 [Culicoides brevitarsis]|uniref:serine protease snake-like isoform X2 n=1 Tax=Culicoides brevitarsis TaxID=469753 RepID=UPI00307C741B
MNLQKVLFITSYLVGTALSATLYEGDSCTRHDNQPGTCVAINNCEWARVNKIRPNLLKTCSFEDSIPIVCCGNVATQKPTTVTESSINCQGTIFDPDMLQECINRASTTTTPATPVGIRATMECQRLLQNRGPGLDFHIIGGTIVELGEYPHMVALGYESQEIGVDYDFNCGGTLITKKHVLTAAHCLHPAEPNIVRMGTVSLVEAVYQEIPVDKTVKHPGFSAATKANDIAILILTRDADISDPQVVYPACLESRSGNWGRNVTVTGWGKTEEQKKSSVLLKADLLLVPNEDCTRRFNEAQIYAARKGINEGQLCAWDPTFKKDSCQGDSGGPLHIFRNSTSFVVGITSFGVGCASQLPGVYTRISHYLPWIESIVWTT